LSTSRTLIFIYDVLVFFVLLVLAWAYWFTTSDGGYVFRWLVPPALTGVPAEAFWFGALGGVVVSMKGIYENGPGDWQRSYNLWHFGRPISGGIAGGMTYLLLSVVNAGSTAPSGPVVMAAAFVIGTQDKRFFALLYEVAKVVVQLPGEAKESTVVTVSEVAPPKGAAGEEVVLRGAGFDPAVSVYFGTSKLQDVVINREGTVIKGTVPPGTGKPEIRVQNPNGMARIVYDRFEYTATAEQPVVTAELSLEPASLDFAEQAVGSQSDPQVVLGTNTGSGPTIMQAPELSGQNADSFRIVEGGTDTLGVLDVAKGFKVSVAFTPKQEGDATASLTITHATGAHVVPLTGRGVAEAASKAALM
jgi:hypothetical protein